MSLAFVWIRRKQKWDNKWWPRLDSNQRPLPCQGSALPTELRDQNGGE